MFIRKANLKDAAIIMGLWKEFMKEHDALLFEENPNIKPYIQKYLQRKETAANQFKDYIQENIQSDDALVLIVEGEGEPVGFSLAQIKNTIPILMVEKIGFITDLFIRKAFRGRGLSSQLKNETFKWLKKKGIMHIAIGVYADNKHAREIYKKWGFMEFQVVMRREL
ncbi:MAG: GNAT family N-acetyltransferase [Candidatus Heimdallarchaeota archaeon]